MNTRLFSSIIATGIALTGSASIALTVCATTAGVAVTGCQYYSMAFYDPPDMTTPDLKPSPPDMIQAAEGGVTAHD
jgi:hypothetical protein